MKTLLILLLVFVVCPDKWTISSDFSRGEAFVSLEAQLDCAPSPDQVIVRVQRLHIPPESLFEYRYKLYEREEKTVILGDIGGHPIIAFAHRYELIGYEPATTEEIVYLWASCIDDSSCHDFKLTVEAYIQDQRTGEWKWWIIEAPTFSKCCERVPTFEPVSNGK